MRNILFAASLALQSALVLCATPAAAQWGGGGYGRPQQYPLGAPGVGARIWVENDRDYFRRGDRMQVRFSVSDDSYVAIVHIDTEGNLDFLFPSSPYEEEYVRGGRSYSLPRTASSGWAIRGRPGIGYFYLLASPVPLDYRAFVGRGGMGGGMWDWSYAGRTVHGDPFWAMQQVTRMLVPDWDYVPFVTDYYTYHIDGLHRYPQYACSDRSLDYGWGWGPSYGSCDRLDYFLRDNPYYYDTRRYTGDRRGYLRDYGPPDPRHGFKEGPGDGLRPVPPGQRPPRGGFPAFRDEVPRGARGVIRPPAAEGRLPVREEVVRPPTRRRPTLERRPPPVRDTSTAAVRVRVPDPAPSPERSKPVAGSARGRSAAPPAATEQKPARRRPPGGGDGAERNINNPLVDPE